MNLHFQTSNQERKFIPFLGSHCALAETPRPLFAIPRMLGKAFRLLYAQVSVVWQTSIASKFM